MEELKEGWRKVKLGEICKVKGGKRLPKGSALQITENQHPYIRIKDLIDEKNLKLTSSFEFVPKEIQQEIKNYTVNTDDIIISIVGTIGLVNKIDKSLHKANLTENCVKLIDLDNVEADYVYYFLKSGYGQYGIKKGIVGAVQQKLPIKNIQAIEIDLPPLETQQKIASILSSLDDKIELNNEMNKTLEEMAQTLFKRWFIDFEFPNENGEPYRSSGGKMVDSELGEIPEGWELTNLGSKKEFGELVMGLSPKSESYNDFQEGFPLLNGAADFTKIKLSPKKYTTSPTRIAQKGDYVFCIRATIGLLTVTDKDYVIGRGVATIKNTKTEYKEYTYMVLNNSFERLKQNATGSVIQGLSKPDINNIKILFPNHLTMLNFKNHISRIFECIENNRKEIQSLAQLRDTLLPKLMNGEVEIK